MTRPAKRHAEHASDPTTRPPAPSTSRAAGRPSRHAPVPPGAADGATADPASRSSTSRDVNVFYGEHRPSATSRCGRRATRSPRYRPVGLRQVDVHPLPEPHERPDPVRARRRAPSLPRAGPLRPSGSTRCRCASGSGWSSRSRTRSRSRSTTTSPSARACSGMKGDMDEIVERALRRAALWDEVKDRLKTTRSGCPAASSSACASPARSPPSPTCC